MSKYHAKDVKNKMFIIGNIKKRRFIRFFSAPIKNLSFLSILQNCHFYTSILTNVLHFLNNVIVNIINSDSNSKTTTSIILA